MSGSAPAKETPNPAAPAPGAPPNGSAPPPAASPWDPAALQGDDKGWFDNKKYADMPTLVSAHRGLEKLMGVPKERLLALPEKMDDPKAMEPIWNKLGRPEKVDGYKVPEGIDAAKIKPLIEKLHGLGAPKAVVEAGLAYMVEASGAATKADAETFNAQSENDMAELGKEWGGGKDAQLALARRAVKEAGLAKDDIDKIERALGTKKTMKAFAALGQQYAEDKMIGGGEQTNFASLTPEAANLKISEKYGDPEFMKRFTSPVEAVRMKAVDEMTRLHRSAHPE